MSLTCLATHGGKAPAMRPFDRTAMMSQVFPCATLRPSHIGSFGHIVHADQRASPWPSLMRTAQQGPQRP